MSEAISGTGFPNLPHPHIAALMRATCSRVAAPMGGGQPVRALALAPAMDFLSFTFRTEAANVGVDNPRVHRCSQARGLRSREEPTSLRDAPR